MAGTNDFSQGKIWQRILAQAIPLTLAEIVHLLYNVVDRVYIGHLSSADSMALTGVGLVFPIVSLIAAADASLYEVKRETHTPEYGGHDRRRRP